MKVARTALPLNCKKMTYEEKLFKLREDQRRVSTYIKKVSEEIRKNKVSKYPVFIAHQEVDAIKLGRIILKQSDILSNYSYNVSLLEEMVKLDFLDKEKALDFTKIYKDPDDYICYFLLTPEDMQFVFVPYDLEKEWQ